MSELLKGLNDRQLEAIEKTVNQSALVLAGAGSGKTSVLTKRIGYLKEQGVGMSSIMAVTFTNKASREMRERVKKYIGEEDAKKLTMGTFHQICVRMLKRWGDRIGIPKTFTISDPDDQKQIVRKALNKYYLATSAETSKAILGGISDLKNRLMTPTDFFNEMMGITPQKPSDITLQKVYEEYRRLMVQYNMLDFDDLIMESVRLLEQSDETRAYYQSRYKYIHVDEYQDTNPAQYQLIRLLAGKEKLIGPAANNVFVVGDPDQSIYKFRGSDLNIILNFQLDFPEARIIKLEQNYRSTETVVAAGNAVIKNNQQRIDKTLFTGNGKGNKIKVYSAMKADHEAEFIAKEILKLRHKGMKYEDVAILYRTNFISRGLEASLINAKIPYTIVGGLGFYERAEIKDTIAYLKVVANPKDDIAMKRVMEVSPGIGKTTINAIMTDAEDFGISVTDAMKSYQAPRAKTQDAIDIMRETLKELFLIYRVSKNEGRKDPVTKMMEIVWKRTAYKEKLQDKRDKEAFQRLENLNELENIAVRYQTETPDPSLDDFLDGVTLQANKDERDNPNAVSMMSIHASKGLEYKAVFVAALEENIFPHRNSMNDIEEERRLMYVAVTRAEQELYLTHSNQRNTYQQTEWNMPSRFIEELPPELIERV